MKSLLQTICLLFVFSWSFSSIASDQKLVNGAGTLQGGVMGASLDLGFDFPEPVFYGLRADFGIGDQVQLGLAGSVFIIANTFGINSLFNFLKSDDGNHFLSLYLNPSVLHIANIWAEEDAGSGDLWLFFLNPGLAYEYRTGPEKHTGLYLKTGSVHILGASGGGQFFEGGFGSDTTALQIVPGLQHQFNKISLTAQGVTYIFLGRRLATGGGLSDRFSFGVKLGITTFF